MGASSTVGQSAHSNFGFWKPKLRFITLGSRTQSGISTRVLETKLTS